MKKATNSAAGERRCGGNSTAAKLHMLDSPAYLLPLLTRVLDRHRESHPLNCVECLWKLARRGICFSARCQVLAAGPDIVNEYLESNSGIGPNWHHDNNTEAQRRARDPRNGIRGR